jgi:hypothetical protein
MVRLALVLAALIGLSSSFPGECRAEESDPAPPSEPSPPATSPPPAPAPSRTFSWWAAAGNFDGNDNADQLEDERGQYALAGGLDWRLRPAFTVEFEMLFYGADYDAPPASGGLFTVVSDEYDLESVALLGSARLVLPKGPLRPYGSLGAGLFFLDADFGAASDGDVDLGGALALIGYRRRL